MKSTRKLALLAALAAVALTIFVAEAQIPVSYTHLTLPTNREV